MRWTFSTTMLASGRRDDAGVRALAQAACVARAAMAGPARARSELPADVIVKTPVTGFAILTIWETGSFGLLAAFSTVMCLINAVVVGAMLWFVRQHSAR